MSSDTPSGASPYEIRPIVQSEFGGLMDHLDEVFHEVIAEEERVFYDKLLPKDRTVSVWDEGELVGTAAWYPFRMTVPGGVGVATSGLTLVGVKATHRRRGLLTTMMRDHLYGTHEAGEEPVAILEASEPGIYGRFGYGIGTVGISVKAPRNANALPALPGSDKYRLRLVDPTASLDVCEAIYDRNVPLRPGMLERNADWRGLAVFDHDSVRQGGGPLKCVVAEAPDGTIAAYARYRVKDNRGTPGRPSCKVLVKEMHADDTAAYAALWRFLLDIDLTDEVLTGGIPTDDPILLLLADTRAAQPTVCDALYTRLVDVDKALAARRYAAPVDVVFEVTDTFCPWNVGRWRLTGDASGAQCVRTTDAADILVGIRELGSAYLGGTTLAALGRAARLEELTPGSLTAASLAFTSDAAPWLSFAF